MKNLALILCFLSFTVHSQELKEFNQQRLDTDKKLMVTLGGWSLVNIAVSSIGWATTENEAKYFHQMNTIWSGIDLALAIPGFFKARKADAGSFSFAETWKEQNKSEKIFLFNSALDIAYITSGFYLRGIAAQDPLTYHQNRGFGTGIILQGGFLFLFDLTAYALHSSHRKNKLDGFLENVKLSDTGLGFKYELDNGRFNQRSFKPF
jgi:hypothetical protein